MQSNSDWFSSSCIKVIQCQDVLMFNSFWDVGSFLPDGATSEELGMLQIFATAKMNSRTKTVQQQGTLIKLKSQVKGRCLAILAAR